MHSFTLIPFLLGATTFVAADPILPIIPFIESVVSSATSAFAPAVQYTGPTGTAAAILATSSTIKVAATVTPAPYWLEEIKHQGVAAFNPSPATYQVFRNVKDFGAKGDGITDDTAAINNATSWGGRCAPGSCNSTTTSPAIVYFPAGTYLISSSIIDYYYTQIVGNPNSMPVLRATANFSGFGLIDGNRYGSNGQLQFGSTNTFYRQIRNLIFDMTAIPSSSSATGVHWPTAQATSLQNCVFRMSDAAGTQHQGIFIESGSGGFMNDLVFYGGENGVVFGNQQFTMRNLTFYNAQTAITQMWNWGWTYTGITVNNCSMGLNMTSGGAGGQTVGSVTFIDSSFTNTNVAIATSHNTTSQPPTAGSLILENVSLTNTPIAIQGPQGTVLSGGTITISGWGQGHEYIPNGPTNFEGSITPFSRPQPLTVNGKYYARSKPQYQNSPLTQFVSVRSAGAKGDGKTDDTAAINTVLQSAASHKQIVFFDAGTYKVNSTIYVPAGSKIVGETYPVIMGAGSFFSSITAPQPVVLVGKANEVGVVEWSDMIVSTQGATAGAVLIKWNLASPQNSPSGMWDVHTRIGGFAGSDLQLANCPKTPTQKDVVNKNCIAAFMSIHFSDSSTGIYLENNWFWTADHDIEDPDETQITIYTGRGLYSSSINGAIWLVGTAVEHHAFYQYQFASTQNVFAGQIQTETAYYQPNPNATVPFPIVAGWNDPDFVASCRGVAGNCANGWGLRVINSSSILVYGAGLYSFFNNYNTSCSDAGNGETCQSRIFSIEGTSNKNIDVYNLNTIGATSMITVEGVSGASYADNINVFPDNIALFKSK